MPERNKNESADIDNVTENESDSFLVDEYIARIPSIIARGLVYIIFLLIIAAFVYSYFSKIDIVVEASSVVTPRTDKIRVLADRAGYLEKIFMSQGDRVSYNAPLFYIRSKENLAHETKLKSLKKDIPLEKKSYDAQIEELKSELFEMESNYANIVNLNRFKIEDNRLALQSIKADLSYWEKEVENLSEEYENTSKLYEKRLTSIDDYNSIKSRLERAKTEVRKLKSQENQTHNQDAILAAELIKERDAFQNRKIVTEKKIHSIQIQKNKSMKKLKDEIEASEKMLTIKYGKNRFWEPENQKGNIIRAQRQGVISELFFKNTGDYVRDGDVLCTIVPSDSPLNMEITVINKDIGFIEKGMKIRYKFDAFPYVDYGTLTGNVSFISPSAVEDNMKQFTYHLYGTIDKDYFDVKGKKYLIKPGMTAKACIVTKKKSIFSMMLGKLKLETDIN